MEVIIKSTSSMVDAETVLIETSVEIAGNVTKQRAGYAVDELMENRYLSGTLEERIEALRQSAERMTETSVRLHFETLAKAAQPEPKVVDVAAPLKGVKADLMVLDEAPKEPVKKTRKARTAKATSEKTA